MRCYDGCPDEELQALLEDRDKAKRQLADVGMRAAYFPMEAAWMVFKDLRPVTDFHPTIRAAADAALSLKRPDAQPKTRGCRACFGSGGKRDFPCEVCGGVGRVLA